MLESLQSAFASNQLVSGGAALALVGIAAMWLREVPGKAAAWAKHLFVTTLTVDTRDALRRINNFAVRTVRQQSSAYQSLHDELQQGG